MASGLHLWSKTAGSNDSADASINWREGMAGSAVNDSARAMMARVAEWRDDLGGIATGGTSTAYTVTTNRGFGTAAVMDKQIVTIIPHTTNGADATLAVDGLTARQIRTATGVNVSSGVLVQGTPYALVYIHASTEFILLGFASNPYNIPIGGCMPFFGTSAPNSSFIFPFGQAISRTTYPVFFAQVSTTFGIGDGSTTFNAPDMREVVPLGKGNMGGSTRGIITHLTTTTFGALIGTPTNTIGQANLPDVNFVVDIPAGQGSHHHDLPSEQNASVTNTGGGNARQAGGSVPETAAATLPEMSGTAASGGSGTAVNNVQSSITVNYILRII